MPESVETADQISVTTSAVTTSAVTTSAVTISSLGADTVSVILARPISDLGSELGR